MQPIAVSSDGVVATAPGGVLCMRSTSSKVLFTNAQHRNQHSASSRIAIPLETLPDIRPQPSWIKRATNAWEMGGWMKGLAEGGYGINVARNVLIMQELQVRPVKFDVN